MRKGIVLFALAFSVLVAEERILLETGFEEGSAPWKANGKDSMSEVVTDGSRSGKSCLRVRDESDSSGVDLSSPTFPCVPGRTYRLEFWSRSESPAAAVYVRFLGGKGSEVRLSKDRVSVSKGAWALQKGSFQAPPEAANVGVAIRSFLKTKADFFIDDLRLVESDESGSTSTTSPENPASAGSSSKASPSAPSIAHPFGSHPRLLVNARDLPGLLSTIRNDPDRAEALEVLVRRCDQILASADPDFRFANAKMLALDWKGRSAKSAFEDYHVAASTAAEALAMGYLLTRNRAYGEAAVRIVSLPAFKEGNYGGFFYTRCFPLRSASFVYDWCFDVMSLEEKTALRENIVESSRIFYTKTPREGWETWADNVLNQIWNWNAGISSVLGLACLAVLDETEEPVRAWLFQATRQVENYLRYAIDPAGGVIEGPAYFGYGAAPLPYFVESLRGLTGEDLFENTHYKDLVSHLPHEMLPGGDRILNICDSGHRIDLWQAHLYALKRTRDRKSAAYVWKAMGRTPSSLGGPNLFAFLLWGAPIRLKDEVSAPEEFKSLSAFSPWRGVMTSRTGWNRDDVLFSIHAQQTTLIKHDQADKGQINLYAYGQDFLIDSGYGNDGTMEKSSGTGAHNLILIDGKGQASGPVQAYNSGFVRDHLHSSRVDLARVDLKSAYEWSLDGNYRKKTLREMRRAVRHTMFIRGSVPYLLVYDDFQQDEASHSYSLLLHTASANSFNAAGDSIRIKSALAGGRFASMGVQTLGADAEGGSFGSGADTGTLRATVTLPRAGKYQISALTRAVGVDPERSDSIFFAIDGGKAGFSKGSDKKYFIWKTSTFGDGWSKLSDNNGSVAVPALELSEGPHEFVFKTREPGAALLAVFIAPEENREPIVDQLGKPGDYVLVTASEFSAAEPMKLLPSGIGGSAEAFVRILASSAPSFKQEIFTTSREGTHSRLSVTVDGNSPEFLYAVVPHREEMKFDPESSIRPGSLSKGAGMTVRLPDGSVDFAARSGADGILSEELKTDARLVWLRQSSQAVPVAWSFSHGRSLEWKGRELVKVSGAAASVVWDGSILRVSGEEIESITCGFPVTGWIVNGVTVTGPSAAGTAWTPDAETRRKIELAYRTELY